MHIYMYNIYTLVMQIYNILYMYVCTYKCVCVCVCVYYDTYKM